MQEAIINEKTELLRSLTTKEILYSIDGHPINPKLYGHWNKLTQSEKNILYSKYIFLCEQER